MPIAFRILENLETKIRKWMISNPWILSGNVAQCHVDHVDHPQITIQNSVVSSTSPVMVDGSQGFPHYPLVIQHSY